MINLSNFKGLATRSLGRTGLILSKKSPEIFLGLGIVGVVTGTVLACRATLKVNEINKETKKTIKRIEEAKEKLPDKYSEEDYRRDLGLTYVKTGVEYLKLYAPAIIVTGLSIGLILKSHNILNKRNAALLAAYELVDAGFKRYRDRVKNKFGEEIDRSLRLGNAEEEIVVNETKGKKVVEKVAKITPDLSDYAVWFNEKTSTRFDRSYTMNHFLLRTQERYANDMLNIRGHFFLNEAYDALGMPRTKNGAIMGWVKGYNPRNANDGYIDFGINNPMNEEQHEIGDPDYAGQPFVLDFNIDGVVFDLI